MSLLIRSVLLPVALLTVVSLAASPHTDELHAKAERGDVGAQLALGRRYLDGDGVRQDFEEAKKWFYMAAERGNTQAVEGLNLVERLKEARAAAEREVVESRRMAEEKRRAEELAVEEQRRVAEERRNAEEAARKEQRRSAEQKRLAEETAVGEQLRMSDERRRARDSLGVANRRLPEEPKAPDQLTLDQARWLLIRKNGHAFIDPETFQEFRRLVAEENRVKILRMTSEGRVYAFPVEQKVEILDFAPEGLLRKVRFYGAIDETTRDLFVAPADLLTFDREIENRALASVAAETKEARMRWKAANAAVGKVVKLEESVPIFSDVDAFWELFDLGMKDEEQANDLLDGMTNARRAFRAGPNSMAKLIGYDGPLCLLAQVEYMTGGRLVRGWFPGKGIGPIVERPNDQGAIENRFAQNRRFVLGEFAYVVKDAVKREWIGSSLLGETAGPKGCFILIGVVIENLGGRTETVFVNDFILRDGQGREFRTASRAEVALLSEGIDRSSLLEELQPGIPVTSFVVFEVPESAVRSGLTLVVPEKGFWSTGTAEVPISFGKRE